jgi:hypothetical protein
MRPQRLARVIATRPARDPSVALVVAGEFRLGRIPPRLWCGYDAVELLDLAPLALLSAKARALFPAWPQAVIWWSRFRRARPYGALPNARMHAGR